MKTSLLIVLLVLASIEARTQSYFDEIVKKHLIFFYSEDSITLSEDIRIPVLHDSLIVIDYKKRTIKKYWETDTNGKIINLYFEVSKNKLFVIQELDTKNREYLLYKRKGKKKIVLSTWIDNGIEKRRKKIVKPAKQGITYFKEGLLF